MISNKSSHQDMKAQIVVIGGGGAGLAAAIAAAEKGVKVIVLERHKKTGGTPPWPLVFWPLKVQFKSD